MISQLKNLVKNKKAEVQYFDSTEEPQDCPFTRNRVNVNVRFQIILRIHYFVFYYGKTILDNSPCIF